MKFQAKIKQDTTLDFGSEYNFARWKQFCKENIGRIIKLEKQELTRSKPQNSFYWLYLNIIQFETGTPAEDLHEFFKLKFLGTREIIIKGKKNEHKIIAPMSTRALSKIEFGEYLAKIEHLTEIPIPNPQEAGFSPY